MASVLTFKQGRQNVEIVEFDVSDPINGDNILNPADFDKIELLVGDVVISSVSNEITWNGNVITIKPTVDHLALLAKQSFYEIVATKGSETATLSEGYFRVPNSILV